MQILSTLMTKGNNIKLGTPTVLGTNHATAPSIEQLQFYNDISLTSSMQVLDPHWKHSKYDGNLILYYIL